MFSLFFAPTARRISAISIADRVAQEQCLPDVGELVGYQIRLESKFSRDTQLLFMTPGVLLKKLQKSSNLHEFTHVIIDEIHERDRYSEFLLISLRDLLPRRPDLRLILMSATLQTDKLYTYFASLNHPFYDENPPFQVSMKGRMFPVQELFLENILQLTGFLDATTHTKAPRSSDEKARNDDLDAEIDRLLGIGSSESPGAEVPDAGLEEEIAGVDLTCDLCQRTGFIDFAEFGTHIASCDGSSVQEVDTPIEASSNGLVFEEYDIDEEAELPLQRGSPGIASQNITQVPEVCENTELLDVGSKATASTVDDILMQYQTMTDDEQVDYFLLSEVLQHIVNTYPDKGAILVFLPGWAEISEFAQSLAMTMPFRDRTKYLTLPLHSGIPSREQRLVLKRPPPGMRKIVLSTNIAETSLTIEDVSFVVNTGRVKEKNYDPHIKTSTLQQAWISQASSKQRKGRAGRTKEGVCFHMFSRRRYESMVEFTESELLRTPLVSL